MSEHPKWLVPRWVVMNMIAALAQAVGFIRAIRPDAQIVYLEETLENAITEIGEIEKATTL